MGDIAAFLVILDRHLHPEQAADTVAAARQLKGVAAVHTTFDEQGIAQEIAHVRGIVAETRASLEERARGAGAL